ncbi:hypothetical protein [Nesterenkonia haasae]|uniref:hypothetical protein n=1 Tax=Nesterenkonia haasae TaxID=2587813 RepID=UPI0012928B81|nr:hypothetical protein [Nesterenkonia haasae]NDK31414.1 hypothetical protein [Nesterenkonia haasae]
MLLKLVDGEQAIIRTRAHHRALIPAAINLLGTIALLSFLLGYFTRDTQPAFIQHYSHIAVFLIWTVGLLAVGIGTVKPLVTWLNRLTYLTTERIVQKNFLGAPQARVIPLALLSQHEMRQSALQEMAGAGDLVLIHGAYGQHQRTKIRDMPDIERFNKILAQELGDYRRRAQARAAAAQQAQYAAGLRGDVHGASFGGGRA